MGSGAVKSASVAVVTTMSRDRKSTRLNSSHSQISYAVFCLKKKTIQLQKAIRGLDGMFDYCLIDCPPTLSHATTNAMTAADVAMVPLQCEFLSLRVLAHLQ